MVKLKVALLTALVFLVCQARGQQSIVFSQYIFNGLLINPAYAGSHVQLSGTLTYRNQWVNFEGAPVTSTLGVHTALLKGRVGVGLLITEDLIGSYKNTLIMPSYAYIIKDPIGGGTLSLGVQAGVNNFNADFSSIKLRYDNGQDPSFNRYMNEFKPNFGGGAFYYSKKMWAGFSVPTILTHKKLFSGSFEQLKLPRFYYLNFGLKLPIDLRTKKFWFHPSILLRMQDGTPLSADLNAMIAYEDQISVGTSYRSGDGAVAFVNFKLSEKFYVGYSYDFTASRLRQFSNGSHEIMINYRTRIRNVHQSLDCPHIFSH
jgi:type IX secretion system PorP/SprF family membrane protein